MAERRQTAAVSYRRQLKVQAIRAVNALQRRRLPWPLRRATQAAAILIYRAARLPRLETLEEIQEYCDYNYFETPGTPGNEGSPEFFRQYADYLSTILPLEGTAILELGAAKGGLVHALVEQGADAWGADLSQWATSHPHPLARGRLICTSAHDLHLFPDGRFDAVISAEVFEHIPKPYIAPMVKEIMRVTKEHALIYFTTVTSSYEDQPRGPEDPDETHINLQPRTWWNRQFMEAYPVRLRDDLFQVLTRHPLYQQFGWHTYVFEKGPVAAA